MPLLQSRAGNSQASFQVVGHEMSWHRQFAVMMILFWQDIQMLLSKDLLLVCHRIGWCNSWHPRAL